MEWHTGRRPAGRAAFVTLLLLALFVYWFGIADRYAVFLYGHVAPGIPPAQPFDALTSSRYWMAGLVATGVALLLDAAWVGGQAWAATRRGHTYRPPSWRRTWLWAAPFVSVGIPAIVMTLNRPTLPLSLAVACVLATLAGLALALAVADQAADPLRFVWLMLDGLGLVPLLLLLPAVELPGEGLVPRTIALPVAAGGVLASVAWLAFIFAVFRRRGQTPPGAPALFAAGLCWSYLLMPLVHHVFATPFPYKYISAASNFFADRALLQFIIFVVAALLAQAVTVWRQQVGPRDDVRSTQRSGRKQRV